MSLAIVYCPPEVQDVPLSLRKEDAYLLTFNREQFDRAVDDVSDNVLIVNDPREA